VLEGVSYDSPEEAARGFQASADVLAVAESPDGSYAVVVVDRGRPGKSYLVQMICESQPDGWRGGWDTNGHGYFSLPRKDSESEDFGIVTLWGEATPGASVLVRWRGRVHEAPAPNGYFLFVDWNVSESEFDSYGVPKLI
jgi:hypothetical protein